jgi:hypothetical protein
MTNALSWSFGATPQTGTATTVTVQPPPAYNSGDLLVMCAFGGVPSAGTVYPSTPSGWSAKSAGSAPFGVFTKTAGSESAYTVTFSGTCVAVVTVAAYPPATVAASSFSNSSGGVVTYSPTFPGGVTSGQTVVLLAGGIDYGASGFTSGLHTETLPATWTTVIPPIGPDNSIGGGYQATCVGLCEYTGPTSNPVITSQESSTFYTGFLVLTIPVPSAAMAITATAGGGVLGTTGTTGYQGVPTIGMALTVEALAGAASVASILAGAQTFAAYSGGASDLPNYSITPNGTNSRLTGALMEWQPGTTYTPTGATTFSQNVYDAVNLAAYGTFHSTSLVSHSGGAVFLGASAPSNTRVNYAMAEILAGSGISVTKTLTALGENPEDFTTPNVQQTAIFPSGAPTGSLLVASVVCNSNYLPGGVITMALADSSGLTWTPLVESNAAAGAYAGIWVAQVAPASVRGVAAPVTAQGGTGATAASIPLTDEVGGNLFSEDAALLLMEAAPGGAAAAVIGVAANVAAAGGTGQTVSNGIVQIAVPVLNAGAITFPNPITPGNSVILAMSRPTGATPPVTLAGNGQVLSLAEISAGGYTWIYYYSGVGASPGATISLASGAAALYAYEVPGPILLDQVATARVTSGGTTFTVSTAATLYSAEFWVGVVYGQSSPSSIAGPSTPWLNEPAEANAAISGYQGAHATGVATYSGTFGSASNYEACIATFALGAPYGAAVIGTAASVTVAGGAGTAAGVTNVAGSAAPVSVQGGTGVAFYAPFPEKPLGIVVDLMVNGNWVDITDYVYQRDPIAITGMGRSNEQSSIQASQMTLTLDNRDGRFSPLNPAGVYYPYLGLNTELRIAVNSESASLTLYSGYRFWGEISEWPLAWDPTQSDIYAQVTVSGIWRRLSQATTPIGSAFRRYHTINLVQEGVAPIAYWPMEDATGSMSFASFLPVGEITEGGFDLSNTPGTWANESPVTTPSFASNTAFPGSNALPAFNGSSFSFFPTYEQQNPASIAARFLLSIPAGNDSGVNSRFQSVGQPQVGLVNVQSTGTVASFQCYIQDNGGLRFYGYSNQSSTGGTGAGLLFNAGLEFDYSGLPVYLSMQVYNYGSGLAVLIQTIEANSNTALEYISFAVDGGGTVEGVYFIEFNGAGELVDTAVGHLSVSNFTLDMGPASIAMGGNIGEYAVPRFERLCTEQGIAYEVIDTLQGNTGGVEMGPQVDGTITAVLQTIENSDCGLLYECRDQMGIGYRTQASMQLQNPLVSVSYTSGALAGALTPAFDDQLIKNDVIVTNYDGYAIEAVLVTGARSILDPPAGVGTGYQQTRAINIINDSFVAEVAAFLLGVGGVSEYRYPGIQFDMARPEVALLFAAIPSMRIGDFLQISATPSFLSGGAPINQLVWGYSENLGPSGIWTITLNCVPETPWSTIPYYVPGNITATVTSNGVA